MPQKQRQARSSAISAPAGIEKTDLSPFFLIEKMQIFPGEVTSRILLNTVFATNSRSTRHAMQNKNVTL